MSSASKLRVVALAAVFAFTGACSEPTGPSDVQPADLSEVLAELQPSSLAPAVGAILPIPVPSLSAVVPSSCSYDAASQSFMCPNVTVSGVTASRSFTLLDASGTPQTAFDRTSTAAVRMKSTFAGTITSGATSMVVDQRQDLTLSGLLTGVHTLNGTSLLHLTGSFATGGTSSPTDMTMSTTITDLVLPRSSTGSQWPQSGTIAGTVTDTELGTSFTTTIAMTFNGTSVVTVTTTAGGFTSTSTIDLANPLPRRG